MMLFFKAGGQPQALPFMDQDESGDAWTNLGENPIGRDACGWIQAPAEPSYDLALQRLVWTGTDWAIEDKDPTELAAALEQLRWARLAELAAIRWNRQQTVQFAGAAMPADDVTISRCTAAEAYARNKGLDLDAPRNWKIADGVWTELTTTAIIAYGIAIGDHMQGCFDRERALNDQLIASADAAAIAAVDLDAGWPA